MTVPQKLRPSALNTLCLVVFLGQIQNYMMRGNLSILIVAMTTKSDSGGTNETLAEEPP